MASKVKTKKELNAEEYYRSLPLYDWWEEFSGKYAANGTLLYTTVWQFIQKKAKTERQKKILWWLLGPKATDGKALYDIPQLDWLEKRNRGFWFGSKELEDSRKDINKQMASMEAVREAGKVNVDVITNLKFMLMRIDQEMGGQLLLPNLSAKENEARLDFLLSSKERIIGMLTTAQTMYAKSQGIDYANLEAVMQQFGQMMAPQILGKTMDAGAQSSADTTTLALTKMLMDKAANYEMPLPDNKMEAVVIDISKKQQKVKPN